MRGTETVATPESQRERKVFPGPVAFSRFEEPVKGGKRARAVPHLTGFATSRKKKENWPTVVTLRPGKMKDRNRAGLAGQQKVGATKRGGSYGSY